MESPLWFYSKFLALLGVISLMVGFSFLTRGFHRASRQSVWHVAGASPKRGPVLLREYGCGACHTLPGNSQAPRTVGPSLQRVKDQMYLAGTLTNTPPNLMRWIRDPQAIRPHTAMPNLGLGPEDARDIAAFLYDLPTTSSSP